MIFVDRRGVTPPNILVEPDKKGSNETKKAIEFYDILENKDKPFDFKVYKDPSVVDALNELFNFKCAYCESRYGAVQKMDVEHFRPKGGVIENGKLSKPGYYWLGANWLNLLPSCADCNRARMQEIPGKDPKVVGKGSQFPIEDPSKRARKKGDEVIEKPVLLNPCLDNPSEHLEFLTKEGIVRPVQFQDGKVSQRGLVSIDIYGLQRIGLVRARRDSMTTILAQIETIKTVMVLLDADPDNDDIETFLQNELMELKRLIGPDQPYLAAAKQLLAEELPNLG